MNDSIEDTQAGRLLYSRQKAGFKGPADVCRYFGWKQVTYTSHENGNRAFPLKRAKIYARAFKVDPYWLYDGSVVQLAPDNTTHRHIASNVTMSSSNIVYQAPLISWVQAGAFAECVDPYQKGDYAELVSTTHNKPTVIALKVVGNSMDRFAPEGATIIVDYADKELMDGKMYVVRLNGNDGATFKRYRINPVRLEPYSYGDYETIIPKGDVDVVGRVVEATRKAP